MNAKQRITAALAIAAAFAATGAYAQADSSAAKPVAVVATTTAAAAPAAQANSTAAATAARPAATGLTRAQVIAELLEARKNGTIPETEADFDVAQTRKHFAK